jgi:hypothetical protein
MFDGYWISPGNDIIPVKTTHIDLVIEAPEKFGLTKDAIKKVYEQK